MSHSNFMQRISSLLLCIALPAHAERSLSGQIEPVGPENERAFARVTADEGFEAFDTGQFEKASELLMRANAVARSPTLALHAARSFVAQGKLVEAAGQYRLAAALPAAGSGEKLERQRQSRVQAEVEYQMLQARIPKISVVVEGVALDEVIVLLDRFQILARPLGAAQSVNAGRHSIVAISGKRRLESELTLREGEAKSILLRFPPRPTKPHVLAANRTLPSSQRKTLSAANYASNLAWAFTGLGTLGIGTGVVAGLMAMRKADDLREGGCSSQGHCFYDQASAIQSHEALKTTAAGGYVIGGLSLVAGAALFLLVPRKQVPSEDSTKALSAWVAPGQMGLRGRF